MIRRLVCALLAAAGAFLEEMYPLPTDSAGTPAAGNDPAGSPIFSGGWGDVPDELTHGPGDPKDFIHRSPWPSDKLGSFPD